jgi:hypothetical protein
MRNSLLSAMLIAFGTTVAMPASAAVKIEHYAFQPPETQHQQMQEDDTGKIVATGSTAGLPRFEHCRHDQHCRSMTGSTAGRAEAAPSETSGQHQPMRKDAREKGVTTGSTAGSMIRTPSATSGDLAAKDRLMTDSTAGTGPG